MQRSEGKAHDDLYLAVALSFRACAVNFVLFGWSLLQAESAEQAFFERKRSILRVEDALLQFLLGALGRVGEDILFGASNISVDGARVGEDSHPYLNQSWAAQA